MTKLSKLLREANLALLEHGAKFPYDMEAL
jgi:hypothetical protein